MTKKKSKPQEAIDQLEKLAEEKMAKDSGLLLVKRVAVVRDGHVEIITREEPSI